MNIGAHLSISKGFRAAVSSALEIGGNTFQFFTRNPRGSRAKALDPIDVQKSIELARLNQFGPLVGHAPYTINLASPTDKTREFAVMTLAEDLLRVNAVGAAYLAVHPGSHVGDGIESGLARIADSLNQVLTDSQGSMLLLEGMAGEGSEIGFQFEHLSWLRERVKYKERLGVILDTCHLYSAGYDIRANLDQVLAEFDQVVGLEHLKAFHVNDTKHPLGSRRDRHDNLGEGQLGRDFFVGFIQHPVVVERTLILETPGDLETYRKEIAFLKEAAKS